ncbi:6-pyruvoyltetrahydropterin/6-carboxytetrahydropterin synthase [Lentzea atacamensis]|uniref:6-carboxy-5,6,7,8-tetrahydropterin synthase n=1 Tax=Lentzea atacamensis TaxID=531938 RepID=A0ABX9DVV6_9PSEU|nr:6-carboxytetrahydropterin synthase [Lentzea atacamensis]RAS59414.1 6-pyruvoyltetrahydropterin/6-carboxytetrahydropterin synthase [Lentzea atacamensis]
MAQHDAQRGGYRIGDRGFAFAAAHRAPCGPSAGQVHGHTFTVEVELVAPMLQAPGFVVDFAELAPVGEYLRSTLDHRDLDEVLPSVGNTDGIADHLSGWIGAHMPGPVAASLDAVRVVTGDPAVLDAGVAHRVRFEAAHRLHGLPDGHKCARLHGHSYMVDLRLHPDTGTVVRQRLSALVAEFIGERWDYQLLNDVVPVAPTSELLARELHEQLAVLAGQGDAAALAGVRVWESPRRWAEYTPGAVR